ncbi:unnamed protein product [Rotaria socialis]|uniref:Uncharacterized protein n=1 Tax=Rotaria socialis TaxID=392032 RepID=A0A818IAE0_9BILA|nr:unnamed protein product [Rotaria socialis]CAF4916759.1 unnamed protein product [Rotaria socialis]
MLISIGERERITLIGPTDIGPTYDPGHLVTKWRNRLFSATADLCFGADKISIKHREELIDDDQYSKLDHGITQSDINPKDRQSYRSCVKLISDDVINLLTDRKDTEGTVIYLMLLKMIVRAYMEKSATLSERLESACCVVFVCRIWWSWLKKESPSSSSKRTTACEQRNHINKYFITKPA